MRVKDEDIVEARLKPKGRPKKVRLIAKEPAITQFSPRGRPGRPDEILLTLDQFEALRLADFKGIDQEQAAKQMGISRATFGRIIRQARFKLSDALIGGKIIRILGGKVRVG
ncbi:DUF134 domain-containing protein [Candidatus Omnitrophota bacterium]